MRKYKWPLSSAHAIDLIARHRLTRALMASAEHLRRNDGWPPITLRFGALRSTVIGCGGQSVVIEPMESCQAALDDAIPDLAQTKYEELHGLLMQQVAA